jgi:hypothetical protein
MQVFCRLTSIVCRHNAYTKRSVRWTYSEKMKDLLDESLTDLVKIHVLWKTHTRRVLGGVEAK